MKNQIIKSILLLIFISQTIICDFPVYFWNKSGEDLKEIVIKRKAYRCPDSPESESWNVTYLGQPRNQEIKNNKITNVYVTETKSCGLDQHPYYIREIDAISNQGKTGTINYPDEEVTYGNWDIMPNMLVLPHYPTDAITMTNLADKQVKVDFEGENLQNAHFDALPAKSRSQIWVGEISKLTVCDITNPNNCKSTNFTNPIKSGINRFIINSDLTVSAKKEVELN